MESKAHDAALKLINDIALVDSDMAAKIKPAIDMFVESIQESTLSNTDFLKQFAEYMAIPKDNKEQRQQWEEAHPAFVDAVNKFNNIISKESNESVQEAMENSSVIDEVPIQSTVKDDKPKKSKDEEDDGPAAPELPEDGFKGNKVTAPLKIQDDDQKLMGKKPPKESELDPNNKPKVEDATPDSEVKMPDLTKMKTALESARKLYKESMKDKVMSVLKESKVIVEAFADSIDGIDDKYVQYLNDMQFDVGLTAIENGTKQFVRFIPIRFYASKLYKKFKEDFSSYDEAMKIAKEWYANKGRSRYNGKKKVPGRIFVELRHVSGTDFVANIYLVKPIDSELGDKLSYSDQELASDMNETYTGEYSDDNPDLFKPMKKVTDTEFGKSNVWKISIPFPKDVKHNIPISKIKHDIVDFVNKNYKETHIASSKMPNWLYSYATECVDKSLTEEKEEFNRDDIQRLAREFVDDIKSVGGNVYDVTPFDFMDWAWDGKVPQNERANVSKLFNFERRMAGKQGWTESITESNDYIKSVIFDVFKDIFDDYITNENPDDTVDWDDAYEFICDKFVNNFEDYDIPNDLVADITNIDFEEVQDLVDEFLNDTKKMLAMGTDPINIGEN